MNVETATEENPSVTDVAADEAAAGASEDKAHADREAAFSAGFASIRGDDSGEAAQRRGQAEASDGGPEAETAALAPTFITLEESDARLKRAIEEQNQVFQGEIRKIYGKHGELNGRLNDAAKPRALTKENFKRVGEEFPEFAESLSQDLSEIITGGAIDQDAIANAIGKQFKADIQSVRDEMNENFLNVVAPGWATKITSKEFSTWLSGLSVDARTQIEESQDAFEVAENLKHYDAWTAAQHATEKVAADKAAILAAAVPATSGKNSAKAYQGDQHDAEAAFERGFRSVRGR